MIKIITITILGILLGLTIFFFRKKLKFLKQELKQWKHDCKSAFVKFGKAWEHFVPFIKDFPADRQKTVFLGMPIDFIAFDDDSIKFIEVKTGKSQLSSKQKKIKKQILDGKVEWEELRYG